MVETTDMGVGSRPSKGHLAIGGGKARTKGADDGLGAVSGEVGIKIGPGARIAIIVAGVHRDIINVAKVAPTWSDWCMGMEVFAELFCRIAEIWND